MSTPQTLDAAILDKIAPKLPGMTIAQIIRSAVRATLRQITNDYDLEFEDLKRTYLEDGADFYDVAAPIGFGTQAPPVAPSAAPKTTSTAIVTTTKSAPTSLSKMKKEDLIRACHELGLDIEGTVPELRNRIKDAGGLPTGGSAGSTSAPKGTKSIEAPKASSKSSSKKPKVPALPAPELTEDTTEAPQSALSEMLHGPVKASKTTKPTKESKKPKKEKPVHDHPIEETSAECQVCETYGNSLVEEAPDEPEYIEETKSLRERLTLMLAAEAEAEDEDGDDEDEEEFDQQETQLVEE